MSDAPEPQAASPATATADVAEVAGQPADPRRRRRRAIRVSSLAIFVVAFLFLLGAVGGAAWGQFKPGKVGPWVSLACSATAALLTVVALWLRPRR